MISKPLNILVVASWYPNVAEPTYGSFIEEQVRMLLDYGHKVTVLHPELTGTFLGSLTKPSVSIQSNMEKTGQVIRIKVTPVFPKARKLGYSKLSKYCIQEIHKVHNKTPFHLIHAHSIFMGGVVARELSVNFGIPYLITEHTSSLIFCPRNYTNFDRNLIKKCYSEAFKVIHVSTYALTSIKKEYNLNQSNHVVIPNMVDDLFFEHDIQIKDLSCFQFVAIGNCIPRKNFELLLNCFKELINSGQKANLILAGDGPEKSKLISLSAHLELSKHVKFLGKLNRREVVDILMKSHIHVSTSKLETFGLTMAESLACGTPVIATDSGGVHDIIDDFSGMICTEKEFSEKMKLAILNYNLFNLESIRNKSFEKFSKKQIYNCISKQYYELLKINE
jgi:glycosyltransferase involved in cell wall biosynthesis